MTREEWERSTDASGMLSAFYSARPMEFRSQTTALHWFLLACCEKHEDLLAHPKSRAGVAAARKRIRGEMGCLKFYLLSYEAEGAAFFFDYADDPDAIDAIRSMIDGIPTIRHLSFAEGRNLLTEAAYFAESAMVYPSLRPRPWVESLFRSRFLCPDLLREHIDYPF